MNIIYINLQKQFLQEIFILFIYFYSIHSYFHIFVLFIFNITVTQLINHLKYFTQLKHRSNILADWRHFCIIHSFYNYHKIE